jgi:hypothetical protein
MDQNSPPTPPSERCKNGHAPDWYYQAKWKRWICRACRRESVKAYKAANPDKVKQYNSTAGANWRARLKEEIFEHYGRACSCCGENDPRKLCIDHVDGGGRQHRESGLSGHHHIGKYLKANGWPPGYQILCWNCNSVKHFYPDEPCCSGER